MQDAPEDETPGKSQSWPRDAGPWPNGCISGEPTATTEPPAWPVASKSYATSRAAESVVALVDLQYQRAIEAHEPWSQRKYNDRSRNLLTQRPTPSSSPQGSPSSDPDGPLERPVSRRHSAVFARGGGGDWGETQDRTQRWGYTRTLQKQYPAHGVKK